MRPEPMSRVAEIAHRGADGTEYSRPAATGLAAAAITRSVRGDRGARRASWRRRSRPGDVVLVEGELGAGKTTFVRGAVPRARRDQAVTSPTFTIGQRYPARCPSPTSICSGSRSLDGRGSRPARRLPAPGHDRVRRVAPRRARRSRRSARDRRAGHDRARRRRPADRRRSSVDADEDPRVRHRDARDHRGAVDRRRRLVLEARDDPRRGSARDTRPRCCRSIAGLLERAGIGWEASTGSRSASDRARSPGCGSGSRRARALARAGAIPLVGVSTLQSLALNALRTPELAVGSTRASRCSTPAAARCSPRAGGDRPEPTRGARGSALLAPAALAPRRSPSGCRALGPRSLAIGDGRGRIQRRFSSARGHLSRTTTRSFTGSPPLNHCRLARSVCEPADPDDVDPEYLRLPDAEIARRRQQASNEHTEPVTIRPLGYSDLPQVIAIERRAFPTPWSLAMFVLELSKPRASAWPRPSRTAERGTAGRLPDLLALRRRLAPDEHRGRPAAAAARDRDRAARAR